MRKGSAREALEASVPAARRCHDRVREEPAGLRERVPSTRNPTEDEERIPAMTVARASRDRLHEGACIVAPTESVRCLREKEAALRRWRETLEHPSELPDGGRIEESWAVVEKRGPCPVRAPRLLEVVRLLDWIIAFRRCDRGRAVGGPEGPGRYPREEDLPYEVVDRVARPAAHGEAL